jgi:hypothetical protein
LYHIINRLSPGTRKLGKYNNRLVNGLISFNNVMMLEMFGREHNLQPGWVTLGNQLKDSRIYEIDVVARYNEKYPTNPVRLCPLPDRYSNKDHNTGR